MRIFNSDKTKWIRGLIFAAAITIPTLNPLPSTALSDSKLLERMDTSRLVLPTENAIPESALVFNPAHSLGGQTGQEISGLIGEAFGPATPVPNGSVFSSSNYQYLLHPDSWRFLLITAEQGIPAQIPVETTLFRDASDKLDRLGIHQPEVGTIEPRAVMSQGMDEEGLLSAPEVFAHKLFVQRAIGGIQLLDSHIVMTYSPNREFKKMIGRWPGIAESGHNLNVSISVDDAKELVLARLLEAGDLEPVSDIVLDSVYEEIPTADRRVALQLMIRATVLSESPDEPEDDEGSGEKTRVYLVSPVPEPGFTSAVVIGLGALTMAGRRSGRGRPQPRHGPPDRHLA